MALLRRRRPTKAAAELAFWRERAQAEGGVLGHAHYERAFTTHLGLDRAFFDAKRILDVGCGPRGSLEWATGAARRVGVDPLVPEYNELGLGAHAMEYVAAPAERLPFGDASFDVVATLNALDHVDDVDRAIAELTRVAAPGAVWLLVLEVGRGVTATEPHDLGWEVLSGRPGWRVDWSHRTALRADGSIYRSLDDDRPHPGDDRPGVLRARATRTASH